MVKKEKKVNLKSGDSGGYFQTVGLSMNFLIGHVHSTTSTLGAPDEPYEVSTSSFRLLYDCLDLLTVSLIPFRPHQHNPETAQKARACQLKAAGHTSPAPPLIAASQTQITTKRHREEAIERRKNLLKFFSHCDVATNSSYTRSFAVATTHTEPCAKPLPRPDRLCVYQGVDGI